MGKLKSSNRKPRTKRDKLSVIAQSKLMKNPYAVTGRKDWTSYLNAPKAQRKAKFNELRKKHQTRYYIRVKASRKAQKELQGSKGFMTQYKEQAALPGTRSGGSQFHIEPESPEFEDLKEKQLSPKTEGGRRVFSPDYKEKTMDEYSKEKQRNPCLKLTEFIKGRRVTYDTFKHWLQRKDNDLEGNRSVSRANIKAICDFGYAQKTLGKQFIERDMRQQVQVAHQKQWREKREQKYNRGERVNSAPYKPLGEKALQKYVREIIEEGEFSPRQARVTTESRRAMFMDPRSHYCFLVMMTGMMTVDIDDPLFNFTVKDVEKYHELGYNLARPLCLFMSTDSTQVKFGEGLLTSQTTYAHKSSGPVHTAYPKQDMAFRGRLTTTINGIGDILSNFTLKVDPKYIQPGFHCIRLPGVKRLVIYLTCEKYNARFFKAHNERVLAEMITESRKTACELLHLNLDEAEMNKIRMVHIYDGEAGQREAGVLYDLLDPPDFIPTVSTTKVNLVVDFMHRLCARGTSYSVGGHFLVQHLAGNLDTYMFRDSWDVDVYCNTFQAFQDVNKLTVWEDDFDLAKKECKGDVSTFKLQSKAIPGFFVTVDFVPLYERPDVPTNWLESGTGLFCNLQAQFNPNSGKSGGLEFFQLWPSKFKIEGLDDNGVTEYLVEQARGYGNGGMSCVDIISNTQPSLFFLSQTFLTVGELRAIGDRSLEEKKIPHNKKRFLGKLFDKMDNSGNLQFRLSSGSALQGGVSEAQLAKIEQARQQAAKYTEIFCHVCNCKHGAQCSGPHQHCDNVDGYKDTHKDVKDLYPKMLTYVKTSDRNALGHMFTTNIQTLVQYLDKELAAATGEGSREINKTKAIRLPPVERAKYVAAIMCVVVVYDTNFTKEKNARGAVRVSYDLISAGKFYDALEQLNSEFVGSRKQYEQIYLDGLAPSVHDLLTIGFNPEENMTNLDIPKGDAQLAVEAAGGTWGNDNPEERMKRNLFYEKSKTHDALVKLHERVEAQKSKEEEAKAKKEKQRVKKENSYAALRAKIKELENRVKAYEQKTQSTSMPKPQNKRKAPTGSQTTAKKSQKKRTK